MTRLLSSLDWTWLTAHARLNALQVACAAGHVECVDLLLSQGAIFRDADWHEHEGEDIDGDADGGSEQNAPSIEEAEEVADYETEAI